MNAERTQFGFINRALLATLMLVTLTGCEMDSFFNPSQNAVYLEHYPSTMPILERLDVIEGEDSLWGRTTSVTPEDLIPNDLSYRIVPGDIITVQIRDLISPNQWFTQQRRIDQGGFIRLAELGDVQAAGLTAQELEDHLKTLLRSIIIIPDPQVTVVVDQGSGFNYTMYGFIPGPGLYNIIKPDLTLLEALATAGGAPDQVHYIYVVRRIPLTEETRPGYEQGGGAPKPSAEKPPVDIEELIRQMDEEEDVSPGVLRQDGEPVIDIDDLEPVRTADQPTVDIDEIPGRADGRGGAGDSGAWIFVEERGEWVRVQSREAAAKASAASGQNLYVERIIKIPYEELKQGESKYNIVVRPDDFILIEQPPTGVVYLEGQVFRPGVYNLPSTDPLTLSRLITAAGGLNQLAIPDRVDLVRMVGNNREAVIRVNLGAIRHRTEPDVFLKPNDHVIVGTSFIATPLAIVRNGFRATYGFGFLLDRNFGNDVFGAPPVNRVGF